MPTVPTYEPGRVQNTNLPSVRFNANASADSFGGAQAQALGDMAKATGRMGQTVSNVGFEELDLQNKSMVREALSQDQAAARSYLTSNVYNQEGKNAVGILPKAQQELEKISKARLSNLTAAQQELYKNAWRDVQDSHIAHVQTFQASAAKQYDKVSREQHTEAIMRDAQLYWNDPNYIEKAYREGIANVRTTNAPWGEDAMKNASAEFGDKFYSGVIASAFEQSPSAALEVLNKYGDKLSPGTFNKIDKSLKKAVESQIVQSAASQASAANLDPVQARELISKIVPADQVENAMGVFKTMQAERESVSKAQRIARENDAYMKQAKDPLTPAPAWMDAKQINEYNENAQKLIKGVDENEKRRVYGQLVSQFAKDPQKFAKEVPLFNYAASLRTEDFNHLKSMQDDILREKKIKTPGFDKALREAEQAAKELSIFEVKPKDSDEEVQKKQDGLNQFMAAYSQRLMQVPDEKRTDWVVQKQIRDALLTEVVTKKSLFGIDALWKDKPIGKQFELESGAVQDQMIPVISPDGKKGKLPASKLNEALEAGFKQQ